MADVYMAGDFRNGTTFEMDGNVFKVVEFQHVKPGKGSAFVRTKLKNVISGAVIEKTFNPSDKYAAAQIEKREMQYLYNDSDIYYFMDNETYEQLPLNKEQLGDSLKFLKENMNVKILSYKSIIVKRTLYSTFYGTGSYPPCEKGLQRRILHAARSPPLSAPYFSIASKPYWEHVGI